MKPINQLIEELRELGSKYKYPFSVRWAPRNGIAIPDSTEKKNYAPANELETMLNAMPRILELVDKITKIVTVKEGQTWSDQHSIDAFNEIVKLLGDSGRPNNLKER